MDNCKNCNSELIGEYCHKCGHPAKLKRIDINYIKNEIGHLLHLEKGFFHTIKELIIRPGQSVREFISVNRNRLVEPVIFLIITSLIYTLVVYYFHIDEDIDYKKIEGSVISTIVKWILANNGYTSLIMGFFMALLAKPFYRKYGYNIFEIFVLLCFVMGVEMLIVTFFGIIEGITNVHLQYEATLIGFIYSSWAIGHFFENKPINYLKAGAIYILAYIIFIVFIIFLGITVDLIIKH